MLRLFFFAWVMLLSACASTLPQQAPSGMPDKVAAPEVRIGERHVYAAHDGYTKLPQGTVETRVVAVQDNIVTLNVETPAGTRAERYTPDWNWIDRPATNLQRFRYDPPYRALPFPLYAGETWRAYTNATDPVTGRVHRVRIDGKVLGWERIVVPGGTFDALKVHRLVYVPSFELFRSQEYISELDWYAPAVGNIVRSERDSFYFDTGRGCDDGGGCPPIRQAWTVLELTACQPGTVGSAR
jgi:hypothetical protein